MSEIIEGAELESKIKEMEGNLTELVKFNVRQSYRIEQKLDVTCNTVNAHEKRIGLLESGQPPPNKKLLAASSGLGGGIVGSIILLIEYFIKRPPSQ